MIRLLVNFLEALLNTFYRTRCIHDFLWRQLLASHLPTPQSCTCCRNNWWRKADWLKVHFAEILERITSPPHCRVTRWQSILTALLLIREPSFTTGLSSWCISSHPGLLITSCSRWKNTHTYDAFLKEHGEELKAQSAPEIAINYYRGRSLLI